MLQIYIANLGKSGNIICTNGSTVLSKMFTTIFYQVSFKYIIYYIYDKHLILTYLIILFEECKNLYGISGMDPA